MNILNSNKQLFFSFIEEATIQEIFNRPHNEFQIKIVESQPSYIIAEEVKTQMVFLRYLSNLDEKTATFVLTCLYYDMGLPKLIRVEPNQMNYITEFIKRFPTSNIIWKEFNPSQVSEEVDSLIKKHLKSHMSNEELKFMLAKIQLFLNSTARIGSVCAFDLFYRTRIPVGKKEPINIFRVEKDDQNSNASSGNINRLYFKLIKFLNYGISGVI